MLKDQVEALRVIVGEANGLLETFDEVLGKTFLEVWNSGQYVFMGQECLFLGSDDDFDDG